MAVKPPPPTMADLFLPAGMPRVLVAYAMRLATRLRSRSEIDPDTGCWRFQGWIQPNGYGEVKFDGIKWRAHALSYDLHWGPIPKGLVIDHVFDRGCRYRDCINPEHLEAVTNRTNILRGNSPAANQARQTHCKNGHLLAGDNLSKHNLRVYRKRVCQICLNARSLEYYRLYRSAEARRAI